MHFPTRLSGAVDSVIFSHSDLISWRASIVFEFWTMEFFSYFFFVLLIHLELLVTDFIRRILYFIVSLYHGGMTMSYEE